LRLRIRACEARPATAKCGGEKLHKGACADCSFAEPSRPLAAYSYRLLNAGFCTAIYLIINNHSHNNICSYCQFNRWNVIHIYFFKLFLYILL